MEKTLLNIETVTEYNDLLGVETLPRILEDLNQTLEDNKK